MKNSTSSNWVRYSEYEWKEAEDGNLYLTPAKTAQPSIYDPLGEYQRIVLDAINIGRMGMSKNSDAEIQKAIKQFAVKYGLFGRSSRTKAGCTDAVTAISFLLPYARTATPHPSAKVTVSFLQTSYPL